MRMMIGIIMIGEILMMLKINNSNSDSNGSNSDSDSNSNIRYNDSDSNIRYNDLCSLSFFIFLFSYFA